MTPFIVYMALSFAVYFACFSMSDSFVSGMIAGSIVYALARIIQDVAA